MGGVLPYKWEAYCSTNGRRIAGFPFLGSLEARKALPYKRGGVLPYKLEVHCRTFSETSRGWGFRNTAQLNVPRNYVAIVLARMVVNFGWE